MHTGCGKNGIIACAPYYIEPRRYLIITQDKLIDKQLINDLTHNNPKNIYFRHGLFPTCTQLPELYVECELKAAARPKTKSLLSKRKVSIIEYDNSKYNFPISIMHTQCLTNLEEKFNDKEFYDLILIDDVHQFPVNNWKSILEYFDKAKVIEKLF